MNLFTHTKNFMSICPKCNNNCISATTIIECNKCGKSYKISYKKNLEDKIREINLSLYIFWLDECKDKCIKQQLKIVFNKKFVWFCSMVEAILSEEQKLNNGKIVNNMLKILDQYDFNKKYNESKELKNKILQDVLSIPNIEDIKQ